jgi:hypothetical protein
MNNFYSPRIRQKLFFLFFLFIGSGFCQTDSVKAIPLPTSDDAVFCQRGKKISHSKIDSIFNDKKEMQKIDSLFSLKTEERYVNKFGTTPPVYFGAAFNTLPYSFNDVINKIKKCGSYRNIFKHILEFQIISTKEDSPMCQAAYAVIGITFIKSWMIVNVDSVFTDPSGIWQMHYSKNFHPSLNDAWEKQERGMFTYPARDINIRFYAKAVDETHTRVGYILAMDPKSSVPGWIFKIVGKWVFPRFMKDLESSLKKR